MFLRLFTIHLKRNIRQIPIVLLTALLLGGILYLCFLLATRSLGEDEPLVQSDIAIVNAGVESRYVDLLMEYTENMDSTSHLLNFVPMTAEEAEKALQNGTVLASATLPEDLVEGILYGSNPPVDISFSTDNSLNALLFSELTRDGAYFLGSAQASTYTAAELFYRTGHGDILQNAFDRIDMINFSYVLEREKLYQEKLEIPGITEVVETELPLLACFYLSSGLFLLILLSSSAFAPALKREDNGFYSLMSSRKNGATAISVASSALAHFLTQFFLLLFFALLLRAPAEKLLGTTIPFDFSAVLFIAELSLFLTGLQLLIHMACPESSIAVMVQMAFSVLLVFCLGGLLPSAFLPAAIRNLQPALPASGMITALEALLLGLPVTPSVSVGLWSVAMLVAATLILQLKIRREAV